MVKTKNKRVLSIALASLMVFSVSGYGGAAYAATEDGMSPDTVSQDAVNQDAIETQDNEGEPMATSENGVDPIANGPQNSVRESEPTVNKDNAQELVDRVNEFRADDPWAWNKDNDKKVQYDDLKSLNVDSDLTKMAEKRAKELIENYSHTRPNGEDCWTAFEASQGKVALQMWENIFKATWYDPSKSAAENAMIAFREDNQKFEGQGHRRAMLAKDANSIGIADVVFRGVHYWVMEIANMVGGNTNVPAKSDTPTTNKAKNVSTHKATAKNVSTHKTIAKTTSGTSKTMDNTVVKSATNIFDMESAKELAELVNDFRADKHLKELKYDTDVEEIAQTRAKELEKQFSHMRPNDDEWKTAFTETAEKNITPCGELIYKADESTTLDEAFKALRDSKEQKDNKTMLNKKANAVGCADMVVNGTHYWVIEFANVTQK